MNSALERAEARWSGSGRPSPITSMSRAANRVAAMMHGLDAIRGAGTEEEARHYASLLLGDHAEGGERLRRHTPAQVAAALRDYLAGQQQASSRPGSHRRTVEPIR